jgi:peptide/nickel transport system permease protein
VSRIALLRLPQLVLVLLGCTLLSFCVVNVLPGDVVHTILGDNYNAQAAAALRLKLGLDKPLVVQYFDWLGGALHGNFGTSLTTGQSVGAEIGTAAPPTVELIIFAQIFGIVIAFIGATIAVVTRWRWLDSTITAIALAANSMPPFIAGLLLLDLLSTRYHVVSSIGWVAPNAGGLGGNLQAMALPAFVLSLAVFPAYLRIFRGELREQLEGEEYVVLARLKGISTARLIVRHVTRNSLFGLLTVIGISTANLFAATVIIEQIFSIPGLGQLLFNSVTNHDSTTVLGCISLIAVIIVVFNLLIDLSYAALDPRVRDAS